MATENSHSCNTVCSFMTNSTSGMRESIERLKSFILVGFENDDELPVADLPLACAGWFLDCLMFSGVLLLRCKMDVFP